MTGFGFEYSQVTVRLRDAVALCYCFAVEFGRSGITVLVEQERFLEGTESARHLDDLSLGSGEQVELSVAFEIGVTAYTDTAVTKLRCRLSREWNELTQEGLLLSLSDGELQADFLPLRASGLVAA